MTTNATHIITWTEVAAVAQWLGRDSYGDQYGPLHESCTCTLWVTTSTDLQDTETWTEIDSIELSNLAKEVDFEDPEPYRLAEEQLARRNGVRPSSLVDATNW